AAAAVNGKGPSHAVLPNCRQPAALVLANLWKTRAKPWEDSENVLENGSDQQC
ncbi:MAG: hypothetical protein RLZZ11_2105, partial [Cyanobacteriota bacterium]